MSQAQVETKRLGKPFTFKGVDDAAGKIVGHGSVFDDPHPTSAWSLPDDWMDIVRPGAFKKTLADHKSRGVMPAMLLLHNRWGLPCGAWSSAAEDQDGLALEGQVLTESARPEVKDIYPLMKIGAVNGLSIGFVPVTATLDEKKKTRELLEVELLEVSIVTFPGNDAARITDVKSADPAAVKRHIEAVLHRFGDLSKTDAKALVAGGVEAMLARRDAAAATRPAGRDAVAELLAAMDTKAIHNATARWTGATE